MEQDDAAVLGVMDQAREQPVGRLVGTRPRVRDPVEAVEPGAKRLQLAVALMTAHFSDGRNIGERGTVREIATPYVDGALLDAYWDSESASRHSRAARERAASLGIRSVPNFIIDGKVTASTPTREELTSLLSSGRP